MVYTYTSDTHSLSLTQTRLYYSHHNKQFLCFFFWNFIIKKQKFLAKVKESKHLIFFFEFTSILHQQVAMRVCVCVCEQAVKNGKKPLFTKKKMLASSPQKKKKNITHTKTHIHYHNTQLIIYPCSAYSTICTILNKKKKMQKHQNTKTSTRVCLLF